MKYLKYWSILACLFLGMSGVVYIATTYLHIKVDSVLSLINKTSSLTSSEVEVIEYMSEKESETQWINIALFGLDAADEMQSRSDAIKMISLNASEKKLKVTSFQRDLLVYLPGEVNDFGKLNHAYQHGGATLALRTLNQNFDLDLTRYITFNFNALIEIVDTLGGIEVDIKDFEIAYSRLLHQSGVQMLNGEQALGYARMRQPDNDYERMDRQLTVMKAIFSKLKSLSLSELYALLEHCLPYVETNLTNDEIINWGLYGLQLDLNEIGQYQVPANRNQDINQQVSYKNINGLNILDSYEKIAKDLHQYIYEISDYRISENLIEIEKSIYNNFGYLYK